MKNKILKLTLTGHLAFLSCCLEANRLGEAILTTKLPGSRLGRGEKGMQPLVPTGQGSTGDNQQTVFKKVHDKVHFLSCNFSNYCIGPSRYLGAYWQSETWLIISWSFCSKECQDTIAVLSLLLPEDPGYATAFNHSNVVLARWKSYFRSLKISRGQAVNELFLFFWLRCASHGCGFCCDFHRYQNLLRSWMHWQIQRTYFPLLLASGFVLWGKRSSYFT